MNITRRNLLSFAAKLPVVAAIAPVINAIPANANVSGTSLHNKLKVGEERLANGARILHPGVPHRPVKFTKEEVAYFERLVGGLEGSRLRTTLNRRRL